jgi:hypothetical protein
MVKADRLLWGGTRHLFRAAIVSSSLRYDNQGGTIVPPSCFYTGQIRAMRSRLVVPGSPNGTPAVIAI